MDMGNLITFSTLLLHKLDLLSILGFDVFYFSGFNFIF